jgi:hypothetical protein
MSFIGVVKESVSILWDLQMVWAVERFYEFCLSCLWYGGGIRVGHYNLKNVARY